MARPSYNVIELTQRYTDFGKSQAFDGDRARRKMQETQARMRQTRGANFEECIEEGTAIAGSPKTVLAELEKHHKQIGFNYLLAYLFLGTMSFEQAMRSLKLFVSEVMPAVERM